MTDVSFATDALLGLEIDEALKEPRACEVLKLTTGGDCAEHATWYSVCPECSLRIAWCTRHHDNYQSVLGRRFYTKCIGPELGGCGLTFYAEALGWEPIT